MKDSQGDPRGGVSRRGFLTGTGAAAAAVTGLTAELAPTAAAQPAGRPAHGPAPVLLQLTVNGQRAEHQRRAARDSARRIAELSRRHWLQTRLRSRHLRRVHRDAQRPDSLLVQHARHRGTRARTSAPRNRSAWRSSIRSPQRSRTAMPSSAASARRASSFPSTQPSTRNRTRPRRRSRPPSPAISAAAAPTSRCVLHRTTLQEGGLIRSRESGLGCQQDNGVHSRFPIPDS